MVRRRRIDNTWVVAALTAVKPDIGSESRFLPTPQPPNEGVECSWAPPAFRALVRGFPSEYSAVPFGMEKLEWYGYPVEEKN